MKFQQTLLYEKVVSELYRIIDEKKLKPGDQLPVEQKLVKELGVSRNVLREAFHILEQRGIITSRQGKGRFLREIPVGESLPGENVNMSEYLEKFSLLEAYEVRQALETKEMEMIVRNASDQDLEELKDAYQRMTDKFSETNSTMGEFDIHELYAEKSGNSFMEHTVKIVLATILEMMHTTSHTFLEKHSAEDEKKDHKEILDALLERNGNKASEAMGSHLQRTIDILSK